MNPIDMSDTDRTVWCAAFAAQFVAEARDERDDPNDWQVANDHKLDMAGNAAMVADLAVEGLRELRGSVPKQRCIRNHLLLSSGTRCLQCGTVGK